MCNAFHVYSYLMCNVSFSENTYLKYSFFVPRGEKSSVFFTLCLWNLLHCCLEFLHYTVRLWDFLLLSRCYLVPSEAPPLLSHGRWPRLCLSSLRAVPLDSTCPHAVLVLVPVLWPQFYAHYHKLYNFIVFMDKLCCTVQMYHIFYSLVDEYLVCLCILVVWLLLQ